MIYFAAFVVVLVVAYVYWLLARSNMDVSPNVEQALPPKQALRFALDNYLPIKGDFIHDPYGLRQK